MIETKELLFSQGLIAILAIIQVRVVATNLGPEIYGNIGVYLGFVGISFRLLSSRNSDLILINPEMKYIIKRILINEKYKYTKWDILSEENVKTSKTFVTKNDWVWVLDPLDGTKDFIQGTGNYAMHLALNFKQKPYIGFVCLLYTSPSPRD